MIDLPKSRTEIRKLSDLNPAAYNPRKPLKPGTPKYEQIKKSILTFGMVEPIVWNERSGNVVGGHQRLQVLKDLGVIETEVKVVDLNDAAEKKLNLGLNKLGSDWVEDDVEELIRELTAAG